MTSSISRNRRRPVVVIHYVAVMAFVVAVMIRDITTPVALVLIGTLLTAIFSWLYAHVLSGASKFVNAKFENLDEREVQVIHEAYRQSHSIFGKVSMTILIIVIILYKSTPFHNDHIVFAPAVMILYYLALNLPKSIVAWTEKEIYRQ